VPPNHARQLRNGAEMIELNSRSCVAAGFVLCILHVLSWIELTYQGGLLNVNEELRFRLVNDGIWLSPALAVLLLRRVCAVVALLAIPIMINFSVRMYHAWEYFFLGVNSLMQQKGHWSAWLMTIMGTAALGIIGIWLLVRLGMFVANRALRERTIKITTRPPAVVS